MREFNRLIKKMGIRRSYLFLLLLRAPFDALRTLMLSCLMRAVFFSLESENAASLPGICAGYGLLCAVLFLYNGIIWSRYAAFSAHAQVWLQKAMLRRLSGLSLKQAESRCGGDWLTRVNGDVQAAFTMMNGPLNLPHLAAAVVNTTLSCLLLLRRSMVFFGITWFFLFLQLLFNYLIVLRPPAEWKEASLSAAAATVSAIRPVITDSETILIYDAKDLMLKNCEAHSRALLRLQMKLHIRNALSDMVMRLCGIGGYLAILLTGSAGIFGGDMAFSDIVYSFQVRGSIMAGTIMLVTCINNLKANSVCVGRINDMLSEGRISDEK